MENIYHDDEYNYHGDTPVEIVRKFYRCSQLLRTLEDLPRQTMLEWKSSIAAVVQSAFGLEGLDLESDAAFLEGLCTLPFPVLFPGEAPTLPDADLVLEVVAKIVQSGPPQ
jgi:hypothetical protein